MFWQLQSKHEQVSSEEKLRHIAGFLPLLCDVLFAGATSAAPRLSSQSRSEGRTRVNLKIKLLNITNLAFTSSKFPQGPSLNSLTAFLIVHSCLANENEHIASPEKIRTALGAA